MSRWFFGGCCCSCALLLVQVILLSSHIAPATSTTQHLQWIEGGSESLGETGFSPLARWRRGVGSLQDEEDCDDSNCSKICSSPPPSYNDTCHYVKEMCGDKHELFDYLRFSYCDIGRVSLNPIQIILCYNDVNLARFLDSCSCLSGSAIYCCSCPQQ